MMAAVRITQRDAAVLRDCAMFGVKHCPLYKIEKLAELHKISVHISDYAATAEH